MCAARPGVSSVAGSSQLSAEPAPAEYAALLSQLGQPGLDRVQPRVPRYGDEAELVEPTADGGRLVAVQVEDLDALVADRGHRAEHALEVARALVAHAVEHQADACHGSGAVT